MNPLLFMTTMASEEGEIVNYKKLYNDKNEEYKKLVTSYKDREKYISKLKKDAARDIWEISKIKSRLDGAIDALDRKRKEIDYLRQKINDLEKVSDSSNEKLKDKNMEVSALYDQIHQLRHQLSLYPGNYIPQPSMVLPPMQPSMQPYMASSMPPPMPPSIPPPMPPSIPPPMPPAMPHQDRNKNFGRGTKRPRSESIKPDKYKTQRCRNFDNHGICKFGKRCHFLHTNE